MVFSSVIFLFLFLPLVLLAYLVSPKPARNFFLLVSSLFFYAWGESFYVALMLASIAMNYGFGRWLERTRGQSDGRAALALALGGNLALLAWFKYANFIADSVNQLLSGEVAGPIHLDPIHLPIGISFFTFQAMSYVVDVARAQAPAERNPLNVALYISLFPQLIAGPIVRFRDVAGEIRERRVSLEDFASGVRRFSIGLAKKVLIADILARAVDSIYTIPGDELTTSVAWLGATAYSLQIYFDFSGYSDMAIGLGRMLGFHFLENFRYPYWSRSVTEFWRRWHISLSTWFRDYLYIPLGGNRKGSARTSANLVTVFLLCGLWHGASWNFACWGLYHGLFLLAERSLRGRELFRVPAPIARAWTFLAVTVGFVLFRADTLGDAIGYLGAMAGLSSGEGIVYYPQMYLDPVFLLAFAAGAIGSAPIWPGIRDRVDDALAAASGSRATSLILARRLVPFVASATLLVLAATQVSVSTHNPFIYFRF